MACSVPPSATLPARTLERRAKPLASSTRPSVSGGQSWRFSLEWPRRASGCRSNRSAARWRRRVSIVSRWRSRRSLAQPCGRRGCRGRRRAAHRTGPAPRAGTADGAAAWPTGRRARRRPSAGGLAPGSRRRPAADRPTGPRGRHRPAPAGLRCAGPRPRPRGSRPRTRGSAGGEDALDAGAQLRPVLARQGEVAAEVAQGALAHPGAAAHGVDEALGEVGLLAPGAGKGGGPADEQAPMGAGPGTGVRELQVVVALHWGFQGGWPLKTNDLQRKTHRIRPKSLLAWRTWARGPGPWPQTPGRHSPVGSIDGRRQVGPPNPPIQTIRG